MYLKMNLCKNCRHFKNNSPLSIGNSYGTCRLTLENIPSRIDPINGKTIAPTQHFGYASIERSHGDCGIDGKLYEYESNYQKRLWNEHEGTVKYYSISISIVMLYIIYIIIIFKVKI